MSNPGPGKDRHRLADQANGQLSLRLGAERDALHALCGTKGSDERRLSLAAALRDYRFVDPEHEVVFESVRVLLARGKLSLPLLAAHLNNRGFPDVELGKYFAEPAPTLEQGLAAAVKLIAWEQ